MSTRQSPSEKDCIQLHVGFSKRKLRPGLSYECSHETDAQKNSFLSVSALFPVIYHHIENCSVVHRALYIIISMKCLLCLKVKQMNNQTKFLYTSRIFTLHPQLAIWVVISLNLGFLCCSITYFFCYNAQWYFCVAYRLQIKSYFLVKPSHSLSKAHSLLILIILTVLTHCAFGGLLNKTTHTLRWEFLCAEKKWKKYKLQFCLGILCDY